MKYFALLPDSFLTDDRAKERLAASTEETPEAIGDERVLVMVNSDFSTKGMAGDEITAVVATWQAGAISRETMFDLFHRGELLPVGRSDAEESRLVAAKSSAGAPASGNGTDGTDGAIVK